MVPFVGRRVKGWGEERTSFSSFSAFDATLDDFRVGSSLGLLEGAFFLDAAFLGAGFFSSSTSSLSSSASSFLAADFLAGAFLVVFYSKGERKHRVSRESSLRLIAETV